MTDTEKLLNEYAHIASTCDTDISLHIIGMCVQLKTRLSQGFGEHGTPEREAAIGKFNRWLGYIQCWLQFSCMRTLEQLRNETRRLDVGLQNL